MPKPAKAATEPRGPRATTTDTVLVAAFRILINEGAHALTPQRLHRETGVARTTIYRNWPDTSNLMTAMLQRATGYADIPDYTGDYHTDLQIGVDSLVFRFNNRPLRKLFGALVEHGRSADGGQDATEDVAAGYIRGVLQPIARAIGEAIERGDRGPGDPDELALELAGPLLARHVLLGMTVTEADGRDATDRFLARHG